MAVASLFLQANFGHGPAVGLGQRECRDLVIHIEVDVSPT